MVVVVVVVNASPLLLSPHATRAFHRHRSHVHFSPPCPLQGIPAIVVPATGRRRSSSSTTTTDLDLPLGIQLLGAYKDDRRLLQIARHLEEEEEEEAR